MRENAREHPSVHDFTQPEKSHAPRMISHPPVMQNLRNHRRNHITPVSSHTSVISHPNLRTHPTDESHVRVPCVYLYLQFRIIRIRISLQPSRLQEQRYFQRSVLSASKRAKEQATMENVNDLIPKELADPACSRLECLFSRACFASSNVTISCRRRPFL